MAGDWYYHASMPCYGIENCSDMMWEGSPVRWAGARGIAFAVTLPGHPLEVVMTGVRFDGTRQIDKMVLTLHDLELKAETDGTGVYVWPLPYPFVPNWVKGTVHADGIATDADISQLFCFTDISIRRRRG